MLSPYKGYNGYNNRPTYFEPKSDSEEEHNSQNNEEDKVEEDELFLTRGRFMKRNESKNQDLGRSTVVAEGQDQVQEDTSNPATLMVTQNRNRQVHRSQSPNPSRPDPETPMIDSSDIRIKNMNKEEEKSFVRDSGNPSGKLLTINPGTGTFRDKALLDIGVGSFGSNENKDESLAVSLPGKKRYTAVSSATKSFNLEDKEKPKYRQRSLDEYQNSPEHDYHIYPESWCDHCKIGFDPKEVNQRLKTFLEENKPNNSEDEAEKLYTCDMCNKDKINIRLKVERRRKFTNSDWDEIAEIDFYPPFKLFEKLFEQIHKYYKQDFSEGSRATQNMKPEDVEESLGNGLIKLDFKKIRTENKSLFWNLIFRFMLDR